MGFKYWLLVPVVVGGLTVRYVGSPAPSTRSKQVVVGLTVGALVLPMLLAEAANPALVALLGVGVFTLFHRQLTSGR